MAVYKRSKEALLQASEQVRDELGESQNSAERVGLLFYDITEHILDVTVTPKYPEGANSVLVADIVVDGLNNLIYAPKGGGGGPTNDGYQKVYFATVLKGVTVVAPLSSLYDPSADEFLRSTPQWHKTDDLPAEGECVYAIWVYFNANNLIITITGPVVINSGNSNGEDGEEIEWIYIRKSEELTPTQMTDILNFLETCKGSAAAKDGKTFNDPDAVPQGDWTDNALGINDDLQYEYAAFRRSKNDENTKKRTWGDDYFHGPLLWSAYGKQGMDGDGIEYIFYADRDGSPSWGSGDYPPDWNDNTQGNWKDPNDHSKGRWTFQDNEFIAEGSRWADNPINIETLSMGAKLWCCIRKKQNGVWQAYSPPVLWSYYAKDGVVNGYTTDLVNENMPVGTDDEGTATNYRNYGKVQAFHNEDVLQYTSTVGAGGYPAEGYFTYVIGDITRSDDPLQIVLDIIVTHNLNDGAQFDVYIPSISNFANINAYIPITVKLPNGTDQYLECTLYGIATGEAGQAIDIWTNADVIRDNDSGLGTAPAQLQIGVKIGRGEDVHTYYSGGVPSAESMNFYFGYRYDDGQMLALMPPGTLTLEPNHSTLTIEMRQGSSFAEGHFVDSEDIPYVKNGATITNILPYYRAVESEDKKPGNGEPDISLNDSQTIEDTTFGSSYPFLYRRDYYTFSDGVAYFGVTVFDRRYFEPAEATYTISTINDNAIIDDLTTDAGALETATLNPITVYLGNDDVTSNCHYKITASNLPNGLKIQTKNGNTKADIELNVSTTINTFLIAPTSQSISILSAGNYYYDVLVEEAAKTKRFKLYIDENVSPDGSFYKLHIEHDTINYDADNNVISSGNPTVTAYRCPLGGGSELLAFTVTTTVPLVASDNMYLVVGSVLNNARTTSSDVYTTVAFDVSSIPYNSIGYELSLYRGNLCVDGPEKIDCTKLTVEAEEAAYVIATINDNAAIDDLTVSSSALRIATLNPITVYKGNENVTNECSFSIADKTLNTTELDVSTTTDSSYPDSKVYSITLQNNSLTKLTPGSYSYDVVVTHNNAERGRKRFKLYIDKDISTDGSFYKLVIENDTIEYDSSETVVSLNAPTAKVYKVPINGDPILLSATVVKTKPTTPSENLYLLVDNTLYNAATTSQQDIVFNTANIPYKADKYELTLYKGNKYQDGPEYIDCTKEASAGVDGYSLVTNPAYIIIDELIANSGTTNPSTGVVTYYAQTLTVNELKALYAIIKVLKGKVPQVIGVGLNTFNTTIGTAEVVDASTGGTVSSSTTALKVYLTYVPQKTTSSSPTGWNQSEGKITFTVTLGGSSFYSVEIPVYINRLGTRFQTIAGDVETTMMSKTIYDGNGDAVTKLSNLGTYLRSSELNVSTLQQTIGKNLLDCSEGSGWKNYMGEDVTVSKQYQLISGDLDYVSSAVILRENVTYTFSAYASRKPAIYFANCDGNPLATGEEIDDGWESCDVLSASGTYQNLPRYYATFTPLTSGYFKIELYNSSSFTFYRPQLEVGTTPTRWEAGAENYESEIKQTATSISLKVSNGVKDNLIINGTFSGSSGDVPANWAKIGDYASINTTYKYNGNNSVRMGYSGITSLNGLSQVLWYHSSTLDNVNIERVVPGLWHIFKFAARKYPSTSGGSTLRVFFGNAITDTYTSSSPFTVELTNSWLEYTLRFRAKNTITSTDTNVNVVFLTLKKSGDTYSADVLIADITMTASMNGVLKESGIDISNGMVNLYGDRVTFSDSQGGNTDKIWIDPNDGTLHAVNGVFTGSLLFHKLLTSGLYISENGYPLFKMFGEDGLEIPLSNHSSLVTKVELSCDIFVLTGAKRNYTIWLPPAKLFPYAEIEIINGTYSGGSGNAVTDAPSLITLSTFYPYNIVSSLKETFNELDGAYVSNSIIAGIPFKYQGGTGSSYQNMTFTGVFESNRAVIDDYGSWIESCGIICGHSTVNYKRIRLISTQNKYLSTKTYWAWMIIEAVEA